MVESGRVVGSEERKTEYFVNPSGRTSLVLVSPQGRGDGRSRNYAPQVGSTSIPLGKEGRFNRPRLLCSPPYPLGLSWVRRLGEVTPEITLSWFKYEGPLDLHRSPLGVSNGEGRSSGHERPVSDPYVCVEGRGMRKVE